MPTTRSGTTERVFRLTEERLAGSAVRSFRKRAHLKERLLAAERRNVRHYGYGVKGFTLSMIETAIEVTDRPGLRRRDCRNSGGGPRNAVATRSTPCPMLQETLENPGKDDYRLVLITKGDLFDQERKVTASGLDRSISMP